MKAPQVNPSVLASLVILLSMPSLAAKAEDKAVMCLETTPDADASTIAIAMVVSPSRNVVRYDCRLDHIVRVAAGTGSRKFGDHSLIAMRPGHYRITASYRSTGRDGIMFEDHEFQAGRVYRIACGGGTVRKAHISVTEVTAADQSPIAGQHPAEAAATADGEHR